MYEATKYRIILQCIVGSTLHGTAVDDGLEDLDLMAVVIERAPLIVGFNQEDTWTHRTKPQGVRSEAGDIDWVGYGLRKYLHLALKGNPTILLALFAPEQFLNITSTLSMQLRSLAPLIVSKRVYAPFRGYMTQQHERLLGLRGQRNITRPELVQAYGYDTKYAGHIVRLGLQGEEILLTGKMTLPMPTAQRELVLAVRGGKFSLAEVSEKIIEVENRIVAAYAQCALPDEPNTKAVQDWMLQSYLDEWRHNETYGA